MADDGRWRFYAAEISYFSAKPRPALRYKQVPFDEILPTPQAYREVIRPRTGLNQIPVVVTSEDETLQDSSVILDEIERVGSSRVDLQACKLEYSIVSPK